MRTFKHIILFFLLLQCCSTAVFSQIPQWEYSKLLGTSDYSNDRATSVAVDINNNIYAIGVFDKVIDLSTDTVPYLHFSHGEDDLFFAKYDSTGHLIWLKQIGGKMFDTGNSITVDSNQNIYITGGFRDTVDFDPNTGQHFLYATDHAGIFVGKYDSLGNLIWVNSFSSILDSYGNKIHLDEEGNIHIGGVFAGTVDFDPSPSVYTMFGSGLADGFHAKYNTNGDFISAMKIGGTSQDYIYSLTTDSAMNVYLSGSFRQTVDFDPGPAVYNLNANSNTSMFFAKYDSSGNFIFAKHAYSASTSRPKEICIDDSTNIYITGSFFGNCDFDPGAGVYNLTPAGAYDMFFCKYDLNGALVFAYKMGNTGSDGGSGILIRNNEVILSGGYSGTIDLDPSAGSYNLSSFGLVDVFVAKYSLYGQFISLLTKIRNNDNVGIAQTVVDHSGRLVIGGSFFENTMFDQFSSSTISSDNGGDMFIAKYDPSQLNFVVRSHGIGGGDDALITMEKDASGNMVLIGSTYNQLFLFEDELLDTNVLNLTAPYYSNQAINFRVTFDPNGNIVSAHKLQNPAYGQMKYARLDQAGNLYTYSASGGYTITKYDPNGNLVWEHHQTSPNLFDASSFKVGPNHIYLSGRFYDTVDLDLSSGIYTESNFDYAGACFVSQYDLDGNFQWARTFENSPGVLFGDVTPDPISGNVFFLASFRDSIDSDPGIAASVLYQIPTPTFYKQFIVKLNNNGDFVWSKILANDVAPYSIYTFRALMDVLNDKPAYICYGYVNKLDSLGDSEFYAITGLGDNGIKIDPLGRVYVWGSINGTCTTTNLDVNSPYSMSSGSTNFAWIKFQHYGEYDYGFHGGGVGVQQGIGFALDDSSHVFMAGVFDIEYDPLNAGNHVYAPLSSKNIYFSKYSTCGDAVVPGLGAPVQICLGDTATLLLLTGDLNGGATWEWSTGSCTGPVVGYGNSITVNPVTTTTYYVQPIGGCLTSTYPCATRVVSVNNYPTLTFAMADTVCEGNQILINANGASSINWENPYYDNTSFFIDSSQYLTVTGSNAVCGVTDSIYITVYPKPVVNYTFSAYYLQCENAAPIDLTVDFPGGIYSGNAMIGSVYYPTAAPYGWQDIFYYYTDSHGCRDTTSTTFYILACLGNEEFQGVNLQMFPNPTNDIVTIINDDPFTNSDYLRILDISGKEILHLNLTGNSAHIDVNQFPPGTYMVQLYIGGHQINKKLIIVE